MVSVVCQWQSEASLLPRIVVSSQWASGTEIDTKSPDLCQDF